MNELVLELAPDMQVEDAAGNSWQMLLTRGPVVVSLQWVDNALRRPRLLTSTNHVLKLALLVAALRVRRATVLWTCHNRVGKAHGRLRLDKFARSYLALVSSKIIVLNEEAIGAIAQDLYQPVRRRFWAKTVVVPMPLLPNPHGSRLAKEAARRALGIVTDRSVVSYFPGANQPNHLDKFADPSASFRVLTCKPSEGRHERTAQMSVHPFGWAFDRRPTDEQYGLAIAASDAVMLTDDRALGSMTLQTAVYFRRPVVSVGCPAVAELVSIGGAVEVARCFDSAGVEAALALAALLDVEEASVEFEHRHSDDAVVSALSSVIHSYRTEGERADPTLLREPSRRSADGGRAE